MTESARFIIYDYSLLLRTQFKGIHYINPPNLKHHDLRHTNWILVISPATKSPDKKCWSGSWMLAHLRYLSAHEEGVVPGDEVRQVDQWLPVLRLTHQQQHLRLIVLHVLWLVEQLVQRHQGTLVGLRLRRRAPVHVWNNPDSHFHPFIETWTVSWYSEQHTV